MCAGAPQPLGGAEPPVAGARGHRRDPACPVRRGVSAQVGVTAQKTMRLLPASGRRATQKVGGFCTELVSRCGVNCGRGTDLWSCFSWCVMGKKAFRTNKGFSKLKALLKAQGCSRGIDDTDSWCGRTKRPVISATLAAVVHAFNFLF